MLLLPLYAISEGVSMLLIGGLITSRGAGALLVNMPAGFIIERFGEKKMVQLSKAAVCASCLGYVFFNSFVSLVLLTFILGMGMGCIALGRHTLISAKVAPHWRGRALSKLSVVKRGGYFLGPIIAGSIFEVYGPGNAFLLASALMLIALFSYSIDRNHVACTPQKRPLIQFLHWMPTFFEQHQNILITAILYIMSLKMIRESWYLLLPLWGNHVGLSGTEIGIVVCARVAMDILFLYLGGYIADHFGRKWSAIPCIALLSVCVLLMPYCLDFNSLALLALMAGIANGFGGGIIMTLGLDLAPDKNRGIFLAGWRSMSDISSTATPIVISSVAGLFALSTAMLFSGGVGLMGGLVLFWGKHKSIEIPEHNPAH